MTQSGSDRAPQIRPNVLHCADNMPPVQRLSRDLPRHRDTDDTFPWLNQPRWQISGEVMAMVFGSNVTGKARREIGDEIRATTPAVLIGSLFEVIPSGEALGAEVRNVDVSSFDSWSFAALMRALLKHQVLLVREQTLGEHDLVHLRRRLGHAAVRLSRATALGTPSSFSSLYAIYNALPPALRRRIANLKIRHLLPNANDIARYVGATDEIAIDTTVQPLVGIHPDTGRAMLHLGDRRHASLVGMELAESNALLDELWQFAALAEFGWQCTSDAGDLLIWDPRSTLHQQAPKSAVHPQLLHRAEIWRSMNPS
jgi:taurine dioxygenase